MDFVTIFLFIQIISAILIYINFCVRLNKVILIKSKKEIHKISVEKKHKKGFFFKNSFLKVFNFFKIFSLFIFQKLIIIVKFVFFRVSKKFNGKKNKNLKEKKIQSNIYLQDLFVKRIMRKKIFELNLKFIKEKNIYPLPKIREIENF